MNKQYLGFTLAELLVSMLIMSILALTINLNPTMFRQTAKREAERIVSYLNRQMSRADRIHQEFILLFDKVNQQVSSFSICFPYYPGARNNKNLPVIKMESIITGKEREYTQDRFDLSYACEISSPQTRFDYDFRINDFAENTYWGGGHT